MEISCDKGHSQRQAAEQKLIKNTKKKTKTFELSSNERNSNKNNFK